MVATLAGDYYVWVGVVPAAWVRSAPVHDPLWTSRDATPSSSSSWSPSALGSRQCVCVVQEPVGGGMYRKVFSHLISHAYHSCKHTMPLGSWVAGARRRGVAT